MAAGLPDLGDRSSDKWRGRSALTVDFPFAKQRRAAQAAGQLSRHATSLQRGAAWCLANPELVWEGPPPPPPPEEEDGVPKEGFAGYEAGALERIHATGDAEQEQEQDRQCFRTLSMRCRTTR